MARLLLRNFSDCLGACVQPLRLCVYSCTRLFVYFVLMPCVRLITELNKLRWLVQVDELAHTSLLKE